ncbi:MAG: VOC family protein [Chloroflexi bacterium]|nr:VOC family protein [Chloroflexota bacterium]
MTKRNIVHIEIPTRNHDESIKFYKALFGWKMERFPDMHYTTWEADEHPGGGFTEDAKPGEVLIHINSDDVEADLKKAKSLGATIVREKTEIPNTGWWGVFKDPTGNQIALFTVLKPN